jgi:hypothetical protein
LTNSAQSVSLEDIMKPMRAFACTLATPAAAASTYYYAYRRTGPE